MTYVDGFVAAVPTKNKEKFIEFARIQADILKKAGALQIRECWGDDVPDGEVTSFPMAVKKKEDETVLFSWIVWPDKSVRDAGMKKMMEDPRMQPDGTPMLLDGKRIIVGGFEVVLEA